ncbi:MAG: ABC-F family ATP-binding cassette domain-containing protein [Candidatus Binataceae bacterium]
MLRIHDLTYRIGGRVLLDQADAAINSGHRVGLVGRNGTGKTTLLRLITGELAPESGGIEVPSNWHIGVTSQEAPSSDSSLIDTVLASDRELTALNAEAATATDPDRIAAIHARLQDKRAHSAPARAARILDGLGFDAAAQQRPCSAFSGGWRMRVALAGLLFTEPELLLLDEPTNHLDLEATLWLEDYLKHYPGTILLVSHDRDLLNRVPTEILHLEGAKLTLYRGGYDRFESARRMQLAQSEKARVKQAARRAEIQGFIDRFRAKATKAKQAQSRIKMLERMEPIAEYHAEAVARFTFPEPEALSPPLYTLDRVSIGYGGKPVLSNLTLRLDTDDRIALLGANGNGKSTLMKLLAGRLEPMAGEVSKSSKLRIGYFAQHQAEELDLSATPLLELGRRKVGQEKDLRAHLGAFGFSQERAETRISSLSGGEKARLLFALMAVERPHILLLDEPTNHLDMDSREALTESLNAFDGAVVIVSHDPYILELTVDRFWLVERGRVTNFDGDMDDYRARIAENEATARDRTPVSEAKDDRKDERRRAAERRQALAPLKKQLQQTETQVNALTKEREQIKEALADPKIYAAGSGKAVDLQKRLGAVEKDLASAEERWFALHEELESAQAAAE